MEFRLSYEGLLLGSNRTDTRADHKHDIRRNLHRQLKRLWSKNPHLEERAKSTTTRIVGNNIISTTYLQSTANNFRVGNYKCVPLATSALSLSCGLHILFLRYDQPGATLIQSGDIDNRLKTLFDALRRPQTVEEARGTPTTDEDPLFCLLEDDKLITDLSVTTDLLLDPDKDVNDVSLIITVKIKPIDLNWSNIDFV